MFELTPEQRHELGGPEPARAIDPETNETYVLIHVEVYERFKAAISDGDETLLRDMYPHVMQLFGRAGWDDPAMDVYNELDPRRARLSFGSFGPSLTLPAREEERECTKDTKNSCW